MKSEKYVLLLQDVLQFVESQHSILLNYNIASNDVIMRYRNVVEKVSLSILCLMKSGGLSFPDDDCSRIHITETNLKPSPRRDSFIPTFDSDQLAEYERLYRLNKKSFPNENEAGVDMRKESLMRRELEEQENSQVVKIPPPPLLIADLDKYEQQIRHDYPPTNFPYPFVDLHATRPSFPCRDNSFETRSVSEQSIDGASDEGFHSSVAENTSQEESSKSTDDKSDGNDEHQPNTRRRNSSASHKDQTTKRPYSCNQCEATFVQRCHLICHLRIHSDEKPFVCPHCPAKFRHKSNLTCHIRIHTGEKPYNCHLCNSSFGQKGQLNCHMFKHTGVKPHICKVCNSSFSHRGHLNSHMRTHTGIKPYRCQVCQKAFTQNGNLKTHMKRHNKK